MTLQPTFDKLHLLMKAIADQVTALMNDRKFSNQPAAEFAM